MTAEAEDPRIALECMRTLYRQLPNSFYAAMGATAFLLVGPGPYAPFRPLLLWLVAQAAVQLYRFWIYRHYRVEGLTLANAPIWARRHREFMLVAGLVWGSSVFLFLRSDMPITVALTMCGLYAIAGGSVPANAYHPPGIYRLVGAIFGAVMLRMIMLGELPYLELGVASVVFALMMAAFCRVQYRILVRGFGIQFENAALVEELRAQKTAAEEERHKAEQASLAKSQFLAAASHDLRQPLHALGLFSATLRSLKLDEDGREVVARIHDNIGALETLFDALLDISRLDAGVVRARAESVAISDLFGRLAKYFEAPAQEKSLDLRFAPRNGCVLADPVLLERILANLIANAIRYTEAGGVLVACRRHGTDRLRLEVWDTGIGIPPDAQARIFEEFVQLGNPERDRRKGLGLGLAIAQRTAALLGSAITLESRPGRGSVFRLELPLTEAAAALPALPSEDALDRIEGLKILIIDDELSIRQALQHLLADWRAEADLVADADEALALVAAGRRYQVVLADFRLRGQHNGIAAIEAIARAQNPPPAACLITGDMAPELLAEARRRGLPLLHKPVRPSQLRAVLNHLAATPIPA